MPCLVKAVVQLGRTSGITADTIDNDFYFALSDMAEIDATRATAIATDLEDFYNAIQSPGVAPIASYLADSVARTSNSVTIKFYSHEDPVVSPLIWGSPKQVRTFTLGSAASGLSLPGEVALVLTYHADLTDIPETQTNPTPPPAIIRPAARRRGRLYLGPFNSTVLTESAGDLEGTPSAALINALIGAADALQTALPANTVWQVYSDAEVDNFPVVGGWVDNAFDSQRRRGNLATARTTWT